MLSAIASVRSLLLAIFMLMGGAGFIASLVSLRMEAADRSPVVIGAVATAYFAGLTIGALRCGRVIARVGHIRAFAAFVALLSASTLTYSLMQHPVLWTSLRLVDGLCVAGVYVCLESWLNERAQARTRGLVLAAYMVALYSGQAVGQFLMNLSAVRPGVPFIVASILISLSIIPIVLTRIASPAIGEQQVLPLAKLYATSPLGTVGAACTGLMLGGFYGLGAVFARGMGLSLAGAAAFMSAVIAGGVALQFVLGALSDRFDRRRVIVWTVAGVGVVALALAFLPGAGPWLMVLGALFGGLSFGLYPLCVAHANDHVRPEDRVGASGGLVLIYSAGAAAGPLLAAGFMSGLGPGGLFAFVFLCAAGVVLFALWRLYARAPVPAELQHAFQSLPRTTPMSAALDPLAPDDARPSGSG